EVDLSRTAPDIAGTRAQLRPRLATPASLRSFSYPQSVAVIGASRDPKRVGYRVLEALTKNHFRGAVYPVNPKAADIGAFRVYHNVQSAPGPIDLAVIVVPAEKVLSVVDD